MQEAQPELGDGVTVCVVDQASPSDGLITLLDKLEHVSDEALQPPPKADLQSGFIIIFTSGTTGRATIWLLLKKLKYHVVVPEKKLEPVETCACVCLVFQVCPRPPMWLI